MVGEGSSSLVGENGLGGPLWPSGPLSPRHAGAQAHPLCLSPLSRLTVILHFTPRPRPWPTPPPHHYCHLTSNTSPPLTSHHHRVYVGNCKFRFSDIKGDTPDFSLISRCRNLDNHLFALIIPIRGFKKKYSIADIMVKSRYALRYQGAVALISRISTQLSALLPPRPIFPTKPVLPNSELILHTKGSLYYLP